MDPSGRVVLVTGASSGIGRELARQLARAGAKVALLARRRVEIEALAREITAHGGEALPLPADITDRQQVVDAVALTVARFGRIDALVNNAGLGYFGPIATMAIEDFDRVLRTNVHGLVHALQAALPELERSGGLVMNVSSGLGMRALPFLSAYAGTKSLVIALSDGLRLELAARGIRVLAYCPPMTDTDFDRTSLKGPGMDRVSLHGMHRASAAAVAAGMVRAIRREKARFGGGWLRVMNALAPGLLDRMFSGMTRRFS